MITRLTAVSWEFDDAAPPAGEVVARFVDIAPADHPDPANFSPTMDFTVRFRPEAIVRAGRSVDIEMPGPDGTVPA